MLTYKNMVKILKSNPFKILKKEFQFVENSGKQIVKSEADRLSSLISEEVKEKAINQDEIQASKELKVIEEDKFFRVTTSDKKLSSGNVDFVLKRMEFGNQHRKADFPILKAFRRYESGEQKEEF